MNNKINISLSISQRLLKNIEDNVKGKSRSDKIRICVEKGYRLLTNGE